MNSENTVIYQLFLHTEVAKDLSKCRRYFEDKDIMISDTELLQSLIATGIEDMLRDIEDADSKN